MHANSERNHLVCAVMLKSGAVIDGSTAVTRDGNNVYTVMSRDGSTDYLTEFHVSSVAAWEYAVTP